MITFRNLKTLSRKRATLSFPSQDARIIDASDFLMLPALIDGHVHFRIPGADHKEDWKTGALAALSGGVTCVVDMPNNHPPCHTLHHLHAKKKIIDQQLKQAAIPLRYQLYFGADPRHLKEIAQVEECIAGIKVFMGASTGELLISKDADLEKVFQLARIHDRIVAVHAEDEQILSERKKALGDCKDPAHHSLIRDRSAAISAVEKLIYLAHKHDAKVFILHISTKEEAHLIRQAKQKGMRVYAETTPHHLFLSDADYAAHGTYVQMNPPLRKVRDQEALFEAIDDGTIDTIGSDHAPHTREEKDQPFGKAPSGVPGIETVLPLLLNACTQGKLSLEKITRLTRRNIENIIPFPLHDDCVIVDLEKIQTVQNERLKTKCGWSPFSGMLLKGWPIYTILNKQVFEVERGQFLP
jgi:dihydroorotase